MCQGCSGDEQIVVGEVGEVNDGHILAAECQSQVLALHPYAVQGPWLLRTGSLPPRGILHTPFWGGVVFHSGLFRHSSTSLRPSEDAEALVPLLAEHSSRLLRNDLAQQRAGRPVSMRRNGSYPIVRDPEAVAGNGLDKP